MRTRDSFIAVDWGTSNRRIYVVGEEGALVDRASDTCGVLSMQPGSFDPAIAALRARHGEVPILLAGMIGSDRGWVEVPYIGCPADLAAVAAGAQMIGDVSDGPIAITPGISHVRGQLGEVMRGEEVQILGAASAGLLPRNAHICHPGTHTKWVIVNTTRIVGFRTVMAGEIFGLLRRHGILADILKEDVQTDAAFLSGVEHALDHDDLLAELFAVRARVLLGLSERDAAASYASGLLIGTDVKIGLEYFGQQTDLVVMGDPDLCAFYSAALESAGHDSLKIDGEQAFLAGARQLAEAIL